MARLQLVSRREAADMLSISPRHFIDVVDVDLPRIYFGRSIRYDVRDIETLIEKRKVTLKRKARQCV